MFCLRSQPHRGIPCLPGPGTVLLCPHEVHPHQEGPECQSLGVQGGYELSLSLLCASYIPGYKVLRTETGRYSKPSPGQGICGYQVELGEALTWLWFSCLSSPTWHLPRHPHLPQVIHVTGRLRARALGLVALGHTLPPAPLAELPLHGHMIVFRLSLGLTILACESRYQGRGGREVGSTGDLGICGDQSILDLQSGAMGSWEERGQGRWQRSLGEGRAALAPWLGLPISLSGLL